MQQYIATGWRIKVINFIGIINLMILFLIFRGLYVLFDRLIDLLTGYSFIHGTRKERELAKQSFEHSAHFVNIVGRFTHDIATGGFLKSFLLWHNKYGDPRVVLKNDNITIQGVTPTHAWFCVSDVDIYDTSIYPFVFISQYVASKSFIIMTHETLHKLAAEISFEKDTRNLILVDNTARCGSTLMCQMFYKLPNTRVMSEPWALQHTSMVRDNYRGHPWLYNPKEDITQMSERDFTKLITSVTKVLFKYENKKEYDRVVLKVSVTLGQLVPYIKRTMPRIKCIMMSRHVKISIESFEKMLRGWGPALTNVKHIVKANDLILNWCPFPYADDKLMDMKKRYVDMNKKDAMAILKVRLIMYGSSLLNFLHHKSLYMHTVVFEDLMKSTKEELELMYQKLDIPTELVVNAMEALKTHSQRGVFTSNVLVKSKNKNIFSDSDWEICDSLFKEMGLPITKDMSIDQLRDLMQLK